MTVQEDQEPFRYLMLIMALAAGLHWPAFMFKPSIAVHPKIGYWGAEGADTDVGKWFYQSFGNMIPLFAIPFLGMFHDKSVPPTTTLFFIIAQAIMALIFVLQVLNCNKPFKETNPTFMNRLLTGSWIPLMVAIIITGFIGLDDDNIFETDNMDLLYDNIFDTTLSHKVGRAFLGIEGIMTLTHFPLFYFGGENVFTHSLLYMGKEGVVGNKAAAAGIQNFSWMLLAIGLLRLGLAIDGPTPAVFLCLAVSNWVCSWWWGKTALSATFKGTNPSKMNKMNMIFWCPQGIIFGLVYILCCDFDKLDYFNDALP